MYIMFYKSITNIIFHHRQSVQYYVTASWKFCEIFTSLRKMRIFLMVLCAKNHF